MRRMTNFLLGASRARPARRRRRLGRRDHRHRRSDDRPVRRVRRADEAWRRDGGEGHQRQGRRQRRAARARGRRRCLRPEAGGGGRQPVRQRRASSSSPGISARARSIPASAVYNEEGILQISPASTNPTLTEQGFDNVFRTCGRDDVQGIYRRQLCRRQQDRHEGRDPARQDRLRQGSGRRVQEGAERALASRGDVRGDHRRRQGLHRADHQDEGSRRRPDLPSAATTPRPA